MPVSAVPYSWCGVVRPPRVLRPPLDFWGRGSPGRGLPIVTNFGRRFLPFFFVSGSNCYDYAILLRLGRQWNDATRHCWLFLPLVGSALVQGQDPSLQDLFLNESKRSFPCNDGSCPCANALPTKGVKNHKEKGKEKGEEKGKEKGKE